MLLQNGIITFKSSGKWVKLQQWSGNVIASCTFLKFPNLSLTYSGPFSCLPFLQIFSYEKGLSLLKFLTLWGGKNTYFSSILNLVFRYEENKLIFKIRYFFLRKGTIPPPPPPHTHTLPKQGNLKITKFQLFSVVLEQWYITLSCWSGMTGHTAQRSLDPCGVVV